MGRKSRAVAYRSSNNLVGRIAGAEVYGRHDILITLHPPFHMETNRVVDK